MPPLSIDSSGTMFGSLVGQMARGLRRDDGEESVFNYRRSLPMRHFIVASGLLAVAFGGSMATGEAVGQSSDRISGLRRP